MLKYIAFIFITLFLQFQSFATDPVPIPRDMQLFFDEYANMLNLRNVDGLNDFFNYYIDPSAKFKKESILVENENPSVEIDRENLQMTKDEFRKYIQSILLPQNKYYYQQNIKEVKRVSHNIYFVALETQESMLRDYFNKKTNVNETFYVKSAGNWIFTVYYENATYIIKGATWSEKIVRTLIDKSQEK